MVIELVVSEPVELSKYRVPEVSKLRGMFKELTDQKCADKWAASLAQQWIGNDNPELYYIDGHVQVYHGY